MYCSIDGCERKRQSRVGYCDTHYLRYKKGTDLYSPVGRYGSGISKETITNRTLAVNNGMTEDCWIWQGAINSKGYGSISSGNRKTVTTHKQMFLLCGGEITKDKPNVLHRCDIKACCNPGHLYAGDQKQNVADAIGRGLMSINHIGEKNPNSKLLDSQRKHIYHLYKSGISMVDLAKEYTVSVSTIKVTIRSYNVL